MTELPDRQTAKIIPFPSRNVSQKAGIHGPRGERAAPQSYATCDFGSGWYHEDAVAEEAHKPVPHSR